MNLAIGIAIGIFILLWIWIAFEIKNAPEYDENGMPIKKDSIDIIICDPPYNIGSIDIDITEDDIVGDLDCIYKGDESKKTKESL